MEGLGGFLLSGALVLWLPLVSFGLLFAASEDRKPSGLETAVALAPSGACILVIGSSLWFGIRNHRRPFALGLLLGVVFALATFAMWFVATRIAA
jgi:hypothetical protein